jgi:hypothetical protein
MEYYTEKDRKIQSVEQFPTILLNDGKVKDPTDVANAFNNFFIITITEKLIVHPIQKGDVISILKRFTSRNLPSIKINPIPEAETEPTLHSLKQTKYLCYEETKS